MNLKVFKFTLVIILLVIFTALAIPQFNFTIGDKQIYYPNIDFSLIDKDSKTGNFVRGRGLYPSKEVRSTLEFSSIDLINSDKSNLLANYLQVVRQRITVAGLKDVEARSEVSDLGYSLVINYPDYYSNPVSYTKLLTGKGKITFASFDSSGQTGALDLSDREIQGQVSINFISQLGSHIQFQFTSGKKAVLTQALTASSSSQVGFFLMDVDNNEQFFIRQFEQNDATSLTVRAIPVNYSSGESTDKSLTLAIVRSYFLNASPFKDTFTTEDSVAIIPSSFSPDGTKFITIMSVVALLILMLAAFIRLKFEGGIKFTLMVSTFVAITVTFLKYSNAALSIGTVLGMLFAVGLVSLLSWNLVSEKDEDANELNYKKYLNLSFVLILLSIFLSTIVKGVSMFYDFIGVILMSGLVLTFMSFFSFKVINYLSIKRRKNV
ncbi:MAG: hypothetical protein ABIM99_00780 [Candidatus Dojkabacteria bacterium]